MSFTDWMEEAACLDVPINYFFDDYCSDEKIEKLVDSLCATCPVKPECYNYGVQTKSTGIWGGILLKMGRKVDREQFGGNL